MSSRDQSRTILVAHGDVQRIETWNQSGASLSYSSLDVPHRAALQACWPITDVAITLRTCAPRNFKKAYAHSSA